MKGTNEKYTKLGQRGREGVTWPTSGIWGPLHILGMVEARNYQFGLQIDYEGH